MTPQIDPRDPLGDPPGTSPEGPRIDPLRIPPISPSPAIQNLQNRPPGSSKPIVHKVSQMWHLVSFCTLLYTLMTHCNANSDHCRLSIVRLQHLLSKHSVLPQMTQNTPKHAKNTQKRPFLWHPKPLTGQTRHSFICNLMYTKLYQMYQMCHFGGFWPQNDTKTTIMTSRICTHRR